MLVYWLGDRNKNKKQTYYKRATSQKIQLSIDLTLSDFEN